MGPSAGNPRTSGPLADTNVASEVFAEDIEALLERLEGVASARVVANDTGEIDRIYITASSDRNEAKLRQTVASALMSRYSLAVDGWRIRVARLRLDAPLRVRWQVQRVDEVKTATETRVEVELRADDEKGSVLIGRARGLPEPANRMRVAAQATLDALRSNLDAQGLRAALDTVTPVPLAGGQAVLVSLSIAAGAQAETYVGAALIEGSEADAVIAATIDAAGKRDTSLHRRGWGMKDRRDQLESMRAHYRRIREPQRQMPQLAPDADGEDEVQEDQGPDFAQIRPERQGGAQVREAPAQDVATRSVARGAMEDEFLRHLVATGTPVHVRCRDGYEILEAVVKDIGTYSILVEAEAGKELIFKHGIISIRPLTATSMKG